MPATRRLDKSLKILKANKKRECGDKFFKMSFIILTVNAYSNNSISIDFVTNTFKPWHQRLSHAFENVLEKISYIDSIDIVINPCSICHKSKE